MGKLRFFIAFWAAKLSVVILRLTKHNGTNFPGVVAMKLCPEFLKYIGRPDKIIAVTGTNGKTTVCNMLVDALTQDGLDVVSNRLGSNINTGIATSLIRNCSFSGRCKKSTAVLEIDERSSRLIFPCLKPDYMIITNLSRDSIMRNGHPEFIANILTRYTPASTKLVLNADDLISCRVAPKNRRVYFGIERMQGDVEECVNLINDCRVCPKCNSLLKYEYLRYAHIGKAYCPVCGFKAPPYDYAGCDVDLKNMTADVRENDGFETYRLLNDSVFNIYNIISVVALLRYMGYERKRVKTFLENMNIVSSRYDKVTIGRCHLYTMLAKDKNAFATTRVLEYISEKPGTKEIILMNSCRGDAVHWSENVCWLYDCDFELLNRDDIVNIVVCSPRGKDYKLRLLMAGIPDEKISYTWDDLDSPNMLHLDAAHDIYVLYGTDSIGIGQRVADKIKTMLSDTGGEIK